LAQKAAFRTALEEALYIAQSSSTIQGMSVTADKELADLIDWLELDSESATLEDMKIRARLFKDKYGVLISVTTKQ
jgi:hypothetical protein